jgi:hypothetical protein
MLIPQNGRIIILDDKKEQAFPLMKMLSKNKMPFTYHSDDSFLLPEQPYEDLRLLFLDINLSLSGAPEETIKSQLQNTLLSLIKPGIPYIAAIWSLKEKEYSTLIDDLFGTDIPNIAPFMIVYLDKNDFFDMDIDEDTQEIIYVEKDNLNLIETLTNRIEDRLKATDAFEIILKWDNLVYQSTSDVIKDILSLTESSTDKNKKLKDIYYKLAEAVWGRQIFNANAKEISQKTTSIFNALLADKLEGNFQKITYELISDITSPDKFEEKEKAIINTKLLLSFDTTDESLPGNVYENSGDEISKYPFNGLIADSLNIQLCSSEFYYQEKGKKPENTADAMAIRNELKTKYQKFEKAVRENIKSDSKFISLELSPICDYAQKKWKSNRICPGILWNTNHINYISKADNLYISPNIFLDGNCYNMVLDLRYFTSYPFETLKAIKPIFRLKHTFLVDIQSLLSRHINRPGITSIN